MRRFNWREWNRDKVLAHGLFVVDVESAFERILTIEARKDDSFQMIAMIPAGRIINVIWRFDREHEQAGHIFEDLDDPPIFVITAY